MAGVAIIGCGVVGAQVLRLLSERKVELAQRGGTEIDVLHVVVRDPARSRSGLPVGISLTGDFNSAVTDPKVDIVVELVGGTDVARAAVEAAINAGKSVVTANKALIAAHGVDLYAATLKKGVCLAFEGAVGGGIPLIDALRRGLVANRIEAIYAILNGTCNFILTKMLDDRQSFDDALALAQRLGFAEADPTLDIDGSDTVQKLAILSTLAMRRFVDVGDIPTTGIQSIELSDLIAGRELGYVCKLLAIARHRDGGIFAHVRPTFISTHHPLAKIDGPFNAVSFYGDTVGHVLLAGRGAGGGPTASAVVADIVDVASGNALRAFKANFSHLDLSNKCPVIDIGSDESPHYLRVNLEDRPGGVAQVSRALADEGISIASLVQRVPAETESAQSVPVVIMTHHARNDAISRAVKTIEKLDTVSGRPVCIPVVEEHAEFD